MWAPSTLTLYKTKSLERRSTKVNAEQVQFLLPVFHIWYFFFHFIDILVQTQTQTHETRVLSRGLLSPDVKLTP